MRRAEAVIVPAIAEAEAYLLGTEAGQVPAGRAYLGFNRVIPNIFHAMAVKSQTSLCSKPCLITETEEASRIGWKVHLSVKGS